jgi:hypothetical protein
VRLVLGKRARAERGQRRRGGYGGAQTVAEVVVPSLPREVLPLVPLNSVSRSESF